MTQRNERTSLQVKPSKRAEAARREEANKLVEAEAACTEAVEQLAARERQLNEHIQAH